MEKKHNKAVEKKDAQSFDKKELTEKTLQRTIEFIGSCDTKASIVLALIGVFLSVIFVELPGKINVLRQEETFRITVPYILFASFVALSCLFLIVAVISLILVLFGRLKSFGKSNIYFGDISSHSLEKYIANMNQMTEQKYERDLYEQVHINSRICTKKYRYFNRSLIFVFIGMIMFFIAIYLETFVI